MRYVLTYKLDLRKIFLYIYCKDWLWEYVIFEIPCLDSLNYADIQGKNILYPMHKTLYGIRHKKMLSCDSSCILSMTLLRYEQHILQDNILDYTAFSTQFESVTNVYSGTTKFVVTEKECNPFNSMVNRNHVYTIVRISYIT